MLLFVPNNASIVVQNIKIYVEMWEYARLGLSWLCPELAIPFLLATSFVVICFWRFLRELPSSVC